ncbi:hypothetical protein acsn021_10590 [Anaerocolumna cellulosilytica]|uniref:Uncharacterized protein n=1 Tax=Anaerocolumna cellulosilytica TaxID=433286 RepID=A0A6S6R2E7_9FIRM|nr:hypothetical protein [Anaerocolumna cellulosilytica]MBB5194546.1 GGDEF domain-containing protein [Anaerocolumna cellulosilytica]BCJ93490.1 hypothetical protein acsn021_10590 [Anaerocolumna cellulosilytica]
MDQERRMREIIVVCQMDGKIVKTTKYGEWGDIFRVGDYFYLSFQDGKSTEVKNFWNTLIKQGYVIGAVMSLELNGLLETVHVNAYSSHNKLYITLLKGCMETIQIMQKISGLGKSRGHSKNHTKDDREKLQEYMKLLESQMMLDSVTNTYNQRYFNKIIYEEAKKAAIKQYPITMILINLEQSACSENAPEVLKEAGSKAVFGDIELAAIAFARIAKDRLKDRKELLFRLARNEFLILCIQQNQIKANQVIDNINEAFTLQMPERILLTGIVELTPDKITEDFSVIPYLKMADDRIGLYRREKVMH